MGGAYISQKILSNKILVWFGLISFPLYLWHWPLLSFARILESETPNRTIRISCVFLSVVLAWITYKFIERPLRFKNNFKFKIPILFAMIVLIGISGYIIYLRNGKNVNSISITQPDSTEFLHDSAQNCKKYFPDWSKITDHECMMQKPFGNKIAIIGDSHANHLYLGIAEKTKDGVALFPASCAAPFINISSGTSDIDPNIVRVRKNAYQLINSAYNFIFQDPNIKTVILGHNPDCSYIDAKDMENLQEKDVDKILEDGIRRTLDLLLKSKKEVLILLDSPHLPYDPSKCAIRSIRAIGRNKCVFPKEYSGGQKKYNSIIKRIIKDYPSVKVYDLFEPFCDEDSCYISKDNVILYNDRDHLSYGGSRFVAPFILNRLE